MKNLIRIDPQNLDQEWLEQAEHMYQACLMLTDAKYKVAQLRSKLDLVQAKVAKKVRMNPDAYDVTKVTIESVKDAVMLSDEFQAANTELIEAMHTQGKIQATVDALDHKKKALEALGYMYAQNFYAAPKTPERLNADMEAAGARAAARKKATGAKPSSK